MRICRSSRRHWNDWPLPSTMAMRLAVRPGEWHPRSVTTTICFLTARSIPTIAFAHRNRPRSRSSLAFCGGHPGRHHYRYPLTALLPRWDIKPAAHQGDVPTSCSDTQNVFLCRGQRAASRLMWAGCRVVCGGERAHLPRRRAASGRSTGHCRTRGARSVRQGCCARPSIVTGQIIHDALDITGKGAVRGDRCGHARGV